MDAVVHRIEALAGDGRYAVAFRRPDGSEQTAVVHVRADDGPDGGPHGEPAGVDVAEASLPAGWTAGGEQFLATAAAVRAFDRARRLTPAPRLGDVDGGWDVSLGNVVLGETGTVVCTAHGEMAPDATAGEFVCPECGARARLG